MIIQLKSTFLLQISLILCLDTVLARNKILEHTLSAIISNYAKLYSVRWSVRPSVCLSVRPFTVYLSIKGGGLKGSSFRCYTFLYIRLAVLTNSLINWLLYWLIVWRWSENMHTSQLIDGLIDWLIDKGTCTINVLVLLIDLLIDCFLAFSLNHWLIDWFFHWFLLG